MSVFWIFWIPFANFFFSNLIWFHCSLLWPALALQRWVIHIVNFKYFLTTFFLVFIHFCVCSLNVSYTTVLIFLFSDFFHSLVLLGMPTIPPSGLESGSGSGLGDTDISGLAPPPTSPIPPAPASLSAEADCYVTVGTFTRRGLSCLSRHWVTQRGFLGFWVQGQSPKRTLTVTDEKWLTA